MFESTFYLANYIYNLLIGECFAPDNHSLRFQFVDWFCQDQSLRKGINEYRIGGKMGAGFKFMIYREKFYVTQYLEDVTKTSSKKLKKVNDMLKEVWAQQNLKRKV